MDKKNDNSIEIIKTEATKGSEELEKKQSNENKVVQKQSFLVTILSYKPVLYFSFF